MKSLKKYLFFCLLVSICTLASAQQIAASCILAYERAAKMMRADGNEASAKNFDKLQKAVIDVYTKEYGKATLSQAIAKGRKHWESVGETELVSQIGFCNKDVMGIGK